MAIPFPASVGVGVGELGAVGVGEPVGLGPGEGVAEGSVSSVWIISE